MKQFRSKKASERGIVLPILAISMLALIGIVGLALDMGHAYLSKTRLQNALDTAALSGAKTLDRTRDTVLAEADAVNTFNLNADLDMTSPGLVPLVEFSDTLIPFVPGGLDPQYVRVSVAVYQRPVWFARVLPGVGNTLDIGAAATAGPSPVLAEVCDIAPIMVCGDGDDTDCSDDDCFGYSYDPTQPEETVLKTGSSDSWDVGPGNYQLIRLDDSTGGADIRENLAGGYGGCVSYNQPIETEPGNTVGPVAQGLNTRFGIYQGPVDRDIYKPDLVTEYSPGSYFYLDYENAYAAGPPFDEVDGEAGRRIMAVPVGDCTGTTNGQGTVDLLGLACFFLTQPAEHNGQQRIYGQFVTGCDAEGIPGPDPGTGPGPHIIQLYKDPFYEDA